MRQAFLVLLALSTLPFAGCTSSDPPLARLGLFALQPIVRGDANPVPLGDCDGVLDTLRERALTEARVSLEQSVENLLGNPGYVESGRLIAVRADEDVAYAADSFDAAGSGAPLGPEVTGTNNQEAGADEGDIVKTDGTWTYVLSDGVLHILHSAWVGALEEVARIDIGTGTGSYMPGELLLDRRDPADPGDDRLVALVADDAPRPVDGTAFEEAWDDVYYMPPEGSTRILVLDVGDRRQPTIEQETVVEGTLSGARLVDGTVYAVIHKEAPILPLERWVPIDQLQDTDFPVGSRPQSRALQVQMARELAFQADRRNQDLLADLSLEEQLPAITRTQAGLTAELPVNEELCDGILGTPDATGRGFTTILAIATSTEALPSSTTQVIGSRPIVYASEEALVLAAPSQDAWWLWAQPALEEATDLQWFDLDGLDVSPRASGRVPGIVQDSFGLDVHDGALRVISAVGAWGTPAGDLPVGSLVAVYDEIAGILVPRGFVPGLAPGEQLWSARFTDDRAYLVTFRQTDPLWVVDLTSTPALVGELQIPGVSTYLHPLDDDALLAIGYGPGPGGTNLDWGSVEVSLFDISDLKNPRRADVLALSPEGGATSSALAEHKAFTYWAALGTLAVPMTTNAYQAGVDGVYSYEPHVGLKLVLVDREGMRLSLRGEVDQDSLLSQQEWGPDIQRSYFVGFPQRGPVSVVSVSALGVTAHDLFTQEEQAAVAF